MMNKELSNSILSEFDTKIDLFDSCKANCLSLIKNILQNNGINYHSVEGRVKDRTKIKEKITRKNYKYNSLAEMTDILGIRVITFFEDEVDIIADLIKKEFLFDKENSIDKRIIENDRFGYKSLHYIVSFSNSRTKLSEYKMFENLKFEIQIRSILQHSWAEIEHDIGYKGEFEIPNVAKRSFSRLSALLELADLEFVRLKDLINNYELSISSEINKSTNDLDIDRATLETYLKESKLNNEIREQISTMVTFSEGLRFHHDIDFSKIISKLNNLGITSIKNLDKSLIKHRINMLTKDNSYFDDEEIYELNWACTLYCLSFYLEKK